MKIFYKKRGFTLVELLVVVAIIGLLASILIANLNVGRSKAKNNVIKENLYSLKLAAELEYDENDSYEGVCTAGDISGSGNFLRIRNAINGQGGTTRLCNDNGATTPGKWCAEVTSMPYNSEDWCVDYAGYSGPDDYCEDNYTCAND